MPNARCQLSPDSHSSQRPAGCYSYNRRDAGVGGCSGVVFRPVDETCLCGLSTVPYRTRPNSYRHRLQSSQLTLAVICLGERRPSTRNRRVPVTNVFGRSAVVYSMCEITQLLYALSCVITAVNAFGFRLLINEK